MAASTGPDVNTYQIPPVALGDTFNTWRDITNTAVYKLNKLKLYEGISTGSISLTTTTGGTLSVALLETVTTGHTFTGNINFGGVVTFNGSTVTMNAQTVTIDDYNIVLGDLAGASAAGISAAGGGGLILNLGSGATAEWLWQNLGVHGITGVWRANTHIGFSGATSGLYPAGGGTLPVHGLAIRLDGGATSDHGLNISLTNTGGAAGATTNRAIEFSRYSPTGATVFMEVLNGTTYGAQPFLNIRNGANRKRVTSPTAHGLSFGTPVYIDATGLYKAADCTDVDKAEVVGVVSNLVDANTVEVTFIGEIFGNFTNALPVGSNLITGAVYYLSTSTGKLSTTPSRAVGTVHKAVLIATSASSAIVIPFTGGLLAEDAIITAASTVGRSIVQINKFQVGDAVRWIAGSAGLSYAYVGGSPSPGYTSATYADGIYVKAQADTEVQAEVVGIVTDVTPISTSTVNSKFSITTTGFFDATATGITANNSGTQGNMVAGTQYFLSAGSAGNTQAFESSTSSITNIPPALVGQVRKPLLFSTTATSGHIISYRGDVNNAGQSSFTGYTGAMSEYADLPTGSIVMGTTGSTLSPNVGVTLYYHNSGGLSGEYGIYLGASTTGVTMNGTWKTRGRALDRNGATGVTAYHLCQRIS